jgi:hypothetical protein
MEKCGDADDCISTSEAGELASSLDAKVIDGLPLPGQVDFINGGPPCQVFMAFLCTNPKHVISEIYGPRSKK